MRERIIRLPQNETHWKRVKSYVEEIPDSDYKHAPEDAYNSFRDMKYGVRIHWGIYSIWFLSHESWHFLALSNKKRQEYQELYKSFNPIGFDAEDWMDFFERAGFKCFAFTTKHHEGFSMYDTKTRVKRRINWIAPGGPIIEKCDLAYSIMETPFKRDIVKELCDAAHKHDIKIDLYFSHPDWYDADFRPYGFHPLITPDSILHPKKYAWGVSYIRFIYGLFRYNKKIGLALNFKPNFAPNVSKEETTHTLERHRAQLIEILSNYGKIDMVCLDMWMGPDLWPYMRETMKILRKIQPETMFRARGIGNYGDYYTPECAIPDDPENTNMPWMVIYPLASSFSYDPNGNKYKGSKWILHNLIDIVSKGGNFMVGIGPDSNGKWHPQAIKDLEEAGAWLKINGEAIYNTRMWTHWKEGKNVRFTKSKDWKFVYIICLKWPGKKLKSKVVRAKVNSKIYMFGLDKELAWCQNDKELMIKIPQSVCEQKPCKHAWVFKIELES